MARWRFPWNGQRDQIIETQQAIIADLRSANTALTNKLIEIAVAKSATDLSRLVKESKDNPEARAEPRQPEYDIAGVG